MNIANFSCTTLLGSNCADTPNSHTSYVLTSINAHKISNYKEAGNFLSKNYTIAKRTGINLCDCT